MAPRGLGRCWVVKHQPSVNFFKQLSWTVLGGVLGGILGVLATVAITALCVVLNPQDRSASSVGIIIILFLPGGIVAGLIVGAIASKRNGRK